MMKKGSTLLKNTKLFGAVCLLLVGLICLPASQAFGITVVIDDFTVGQGDSTTPALVLTAPGIAPPPPPGGATATGTPAQIIGTYRHLELTQTANTSNDQTKAFVNATQWATENGPNATGWAKVIWNGSSNPASYGLAVNMSTLTHIHFSSVYSDIPTTFRIRLFNSAGNYAEGTVTTPGLVSVDDVYLEPGSDFTLVGTFSWSNNITRIELFYDPKLNIDTFFNALDYDYGLPNIDCVSKRCTLNSDYSGLNLAINLPSAQSFPVTLYCEFVVANEGDGNDTVYMEDDLPQNMALVSATPSVQAPGGFVLGNASGTGPGPVTISWTSITELKQSTSPLVFRHSVTVTEFEGVRVNTFRARAEGDTSWGTGCPFTLTHAVQRVPSLNEWGMIILSLILAASAVWFLRRRKTN